MHNWCIAIMHPNIEVKFWWFVINWLEDISIVLVLLNRPVLHLSAVSLTENINFIYRLMYW